MTSEERIEKVSQLLMEGMTDGKKSKENYLKIAQLEVDNIVSAITPSRLLKQVLFFLHLNKLRK